MRSFICLLSLVSVSVFAAPKKIAAPAAPTAPIMPSTETYNVRTGVLGLLIGYPNLRGDMKLNDQWTIGIDLAGMNRKRDDVEMKAFGFGVIATHFFSGVYNDGWYVDVGTHFQTIKAEAKSKATGNTYSATVDNYTLHAIGGYHWFWHPFNLNLGLGAQANSVNKITVKDQTGSTVSSTDVNPIGLAADFSIGVTF